MVRKTKWFILFVVFAMVAAACGGDDGSDGTSATTSGGGGEATTTTASGTPPTTVATAEPIEIEFWHAMADDLGLVVQELVDRYNASQDNVIVNATFQGSYDDTYNALLASFEAGTAPNITQNFDLAAQTMFDTGRLVPA